MPAQTIAVLNGTSRTFKHLIPQALSQGHRVRAVVRSAARFFAQAKKHDDLSAHEWSDFSDLATLARILEGVDVVYVAYAAGGRALLEPSRLNQDAVISIGTVLRDRVVPDSRSPVKVVMLVSYATRPGEPRRAVAEALVGNQFDDLRAAQGYLERQKSWLDIVFVSPGPLMDSESSDDPATLAAVRLSEGGAPQGRMGYARLASAMLLAAEDPRWVGKCALPTATTEISWSLGHMESALETVQVHARYTLLPMLAKAAGCMIAGSAIGYVVGVREGGEWALRLGFKLKS